MKLTCASCRCCYFVSDESPSVRSGRWSCTRCGSRAQNGRSLRSLAPTVAPRLAAPRGGVSNERAVSVVFGAVDADPPTTGGSSPAQIVEDAWCVDDGTAQRTMTTFELWLAVAKGEVGPLSRVWREGMDGWRRLGQLPELACAFDDGAEIVEATERAVENAEPLSLAPPTLTSTGTEWILRGSDYTVVSAIASTPASERESAVRAEPWACDSLRRAAPTLRVRIDVPA